MSGMRLSTFTILDHYPAGGRSVGERIRGGIELCELADELGYEVCWVGEHHFSDFGVMPNPAVWLAAIAQRTRRVRLGPAVAVLPFRHPLQVVEDYMLVDQLSGGRLNLAVGSGAVPLEFTGFGIDIAEKRERFDRALDVVRAALRDGSCNVPPVHADGPPLYVATNRAEAARHVGARSEGLLTLVSPDADGPAIIRERLDAHQKGLREAGHKPNENDHAVAIMAHVAESDEAARRNARPALIRFLQSHGRVSEPDAGRVFDRACEHRSVLCGSPETFAEGLRRLGDLGARHVALWMDFGDLQRKSVECSMRLAAEARQRPAFAC